MLKIEGTPKGVIVNGIEIPNENIVPAIIAVGVGVLVYAILTKQ